MAETSTQALIAEGRNREQLRDRYVLEGPAYLMRLCDRLAAELARLSTPPEGSNGLDVASDGPVADAGPHSPAPSPTRGGAIGETVPIREAVARVIYPRFSRSPTSLSADNQAISALRKADAILALISPPSSTNRAGAGE